MADVIQITIDGNASGLVGAVGQAEGALGRLEGSAGKSSNALQTMLGVGAVAGVTALAGGLTAAVSSAMGFEKQMSAVGAVAGATEGQMKGLTALALQLGKDTSFSAKEAAVGLEELMKAGVSVADAMGGGARAALDLAAAGAVSVGEAAEIAANAMNVFGLKGADMAHVADLIAGAANASAISVTDYKFSLASAGAVASTIGIGFEDLTVAITALGNAGIKGSDAGTSLKTMMLNLDNDSKPARKAMRELGILTADGANKFFDAEGKVKSFRDISEILKTSLQGLTKEQQINKLQTIFGTDAVRAAAVMAGLGAEKYDALAESVNKVSARQVAEERLNNLAGSVEKVRGSLETGAIILGGVFTPALKAMADMATEGVNTAIDALEQLPDAWTTIQQVFAGDWSPDASIRPFTNAVGEAALVIRGLVEQVNAIPAPLKAAGVAFAAVMVGAGPLGAVLNGVGLALKLLAAPIAAVLSPLGLLAVAVGALAAAWTANLGDIQGKTAAFMGIVGPAFEKLGPIVQKALGGDVAGAFADFKTLVTDTAAQLGPLLAQWGEEFVNWVPGAISSMVASLSDLVGSIDWAGIWARATTAATALATYLGGLAVDFGTWLGAQAALIPWATVWTNVTTAATALGTWLLTQVVDFATWLEAQVALIPWATVWTKATTIGTTFSTYLLQQIVDFTTWLSQQIAAVDWVRLGSEAGVLFGTMFGDALKNTDWKAVATTTGTLLGAALAVAITTANTWTAFKQGLIDGFTQSINGVSYTSVVQSLGDQIVNVLKAAWEMAIGRYIPPIPDWLRNAVGMPSTLGTRGITGAAAGGDFDAQAIAAAKKYGLEDPTGFAAQLRQESGNYDPEVVSGRRKSSAGATGIAQFMPGTAARYGVDPTNAEASIEAAARYMADLVRETGSQKEAAARYYGAPSASSMDGRIYLNAVENQRKNVRMPSALPQVSQFALGLAPDDAAAACGPAALAWFMNQTGRTPTGQEAVQLAKAGGWDATRGMYGAGAFSTALTKAGVSNVLDTTPTRDEVGALAASGTPFAISTSGTTDEFGRNRPGHYFQVQGGSPEGLNVGLSGTALKGGSSVMSLDQIMAMTGPMNGIITLSGQMGNAVMTMTDQVTTGFGLVKESGEQMGDSLGVTVPAQVETMGSSLVSMSTDALGNVTRIFTENGVVIGATITDASGVIVNTWGTMTQTVAGQTAALATSVPEQTSGMAAAVLTSVTDLGTGILTTMTDAAGSTISTVTDMSGQVTSQYATLANGVSLTMGDMAGGVLTSVTDMGSGMVTVVQDANGNMIGTVTDASGKVTSQYTAMGTNSGAAVTGLANTTKTKTGEIASSMSSTEAPVKSLYSTINNVPNPSYDKVISGLGKVKKAVEETTASWVKLEDAMSNADKDADKGGSKGGSKGLGKGKASGGTVYSGMVYPVGELGPELFAPGVTGTIIPNHKLMGYGGNDGGVTNVTIIVNGVNKDPAQVAEEVRAEFIKAARRNGGDENLFR